MGQETTQSRYTKAEEKEFTLRLKEETELLKKWIKEKKRTPSPLRCGYEVEGWIINNQWLPFACSDQFLKDINDTHITPELSKFNFEINGNAFYVNSNLAERLEKDFQIYWNKGSDAAKKQSAKIIFIGTYPDLTLISFGMNEIFPRNRYYAINDRIKKLRKDNSIPIQIKGQDTFFLNTSDIMYEAQTTSLQIHLQVDFANAKDFYNASLIASPIMSALCANSPYVCGKELWDESRIPLFEQVIPLKAKGKEKISRVGLGHGFVQKCVSELFDQNLLHPVLLPDIRSQSREKLEHLSLHNGTIWRWNRPIIGLDKTGQPHFRVEHRVPSAGPTLIDMQANILFFIGLVHLIKNHIQTHGLPFSFPELENSFYRSSQFGLTSQIKWIDGKTHHLYELISHKLTPKIKEELKKLSLNCHQTDYLINDVIKNRASELQNGSFWQKSFVKKHGKKFERLVEHYWKNQSQNIPVYKWKVDNHNFRKDKEKNLGKTNQNEINEQVKILQNIPEGLLNVKPKDLTQIIDRPTLLHLKGEKRSPLFLSVLLHGSEISGLVILQKVLNQYRFQKLPRDLVVFIGNPLACAQGVRHLSHQPDFNRIWKKVENPIVQTVLQYVKEQNIYAAIDIHNNSGKNPIYSCINDKNKEFIKLAQEFSENIVYFTKPDSVLSAALSGLCPCLVIECGLPGEIQGISSGMKFVQTILSKEEAWKKNKLKVNHIYHTYATLYVTSDSVISFHRELKNHSKLFKNSSICLTDQFDEFNFKNLKTGTLLGKIRDHERIKLIDHKGIDIFDQIFSIVENTLVVKTPFIPAMFTKDITIAKSDCLGYIMKKIHL